MSYYKFKKHDQIINVIKAYPKNEFLIWSGSVYYNNSSQSGSNINTPDGHINLYEMNVNRDTTIPAGSSPGPLHTNGAVYSTLITPFLIKDTKDEVMFKGIAAKQYFNDYDTGAVIRGTYPLTSSISRHYYDYTDADHAAHQPATDSMADNLLINGQWPQHQIPQDIPEFGIDAFGKIPEDTNVKTKFYKPNVGGRRRRYIEALKNTCNYYTYMSPHYEFSSSLNELNRDFAKVKLNLISIPSIYYGSAIKKGTVRLKFFITGTLAGELYDEKANGELIQVGPRGSKGSGSVAGIALYNEGFLILTGSWDLVSSYKRAYNTGSAPISDVVTPQWLYFGASMPTSVYYKGGETVLGSSLNSCRVPWASDPVFVHSSSFSMVFSGTNHVPVITMFAHAPKAELNYSNNFTFLKNKSYTEGTKLSSSAKQHYTEYNKVKIKNTVKSNFDNYDETFEKQTFISKIGIYDENKNLIAVAKLANPIRKKEDRDLTFKMKLDM